MPRKKKIMVEERDYSNMYPFTLTIIYQHGGNFTEMVKECVKTYPELNELLEEPLEDCIISFVYSNPDSGAIYFFLTDTFGLDVLVHECIHITSSIFDKMNTQHTDETEEIYAYLNEFMFRETYSILTTRFKLKLTMMQQ